MLAESIFLRVHFSEDLYLDINGINYLTSYNVLYEVDSGEDGLVGSLSANELTFTLLDKDNLFTSTNVDSPYSAYLGNSLRVEVFNGDISNRLGVFYTTEWVASSGVLKRVVNVRAVDRLQNILNTPVMGLDVNKDSTLGLYLVRLFKHVGFPLEQISIEEGVDRPLNYELLSGKKLSEVLNDVSLAGDCYIFMDYDNKVCVRKKDVSGDTSHILSSSSNIVEVKPSSSLINTYESVSVSYSLPSISGSKLLLSLENKKFKLGNTRLNGLSIGEGVYSIDYVGVNSKSGVFVNALLGSQSTLNLDIASSSPEEVEATINVYGRTVSYTNSLVTLGKPLGDDSNKELKVESILVQDENSANELANKFWSKVNYTTPYIGLKIIASNFNYKLLEICEVEASIVGVVFKGYINSLSYTWSGGDSLRVQVGLRYLPEIVEENS